jgi:hypothetical protein
MRQLVVFFKDVEKRMLDDPGAQLQQVLEFKRQLEVSKKHLFMQFQTPVEFQKQLRKFLAQWAFDHGVGAQEHIEILRKGVKIWNKWRAQNALVVPRLPRVGLKGRYLSGIDLRNSDLTSADLSDADLSNSRLSGAVLNRALMIRTNLFRADLSATDLRSAILADAHLGEADLSRAKVGGTNFSTVDLSTVKGLATVQHEGPSNVGIDTIYESRGKIPEAFLRGCGVPDEFIAYIGALVRRPIEFYSCFISYSTVDREFAARLHADLRSIGVRSWLAPEEMKGGRKLHEQIDEDIRLHDRLLLILSEHSMNSNWVKTEIANAREREKREGKQLLFPITLVPFEAIKQWKLFDADIGIDSAREIREYFIPDFSNWKDHDSYQTAFQRLVKDLKAGTGG